MDKDDTARCYFAKVVRHLCWWRGAERSHDGCKRLAAENSKVIFLLSSGKLGLASRTFIPQTANRQLKTVVRLAEFSEIPLLSLSLSRTDTHTHMHMHTPPCTCVTLRWVSKAHPPSPPSSLWVYLAVSARCPLQYVPNVWTPFGENGACPSGWLGEGLMMKR